MGPRRVFISFESAGGNFLNIIISPMHPNTFHNFLDFCRERHSGTRGPGFARKILTLKLGAHAFPQLVTTQVTVNSQ